jgi:hypothetical protein
VIANVSPETRFLGMTKDALEFFKEIAKIKDQHSDRKSADERMLL